MNKKKILIFILIISLILAMINCTPTVDSDTYNFEFKDSTEYLSAYIAGAGDNAIFSHNDYRCIGHKNGSKFLDSTFKNISLLFKLNDGVNWRFIKNIGTYDSIFYVATISSDSIIVNIDNSSYNIFFEDATTIIDSFNYSLYPNTVQLNILEDSTTVSLIDSTNNLYNNSYVPYSDWKKGILEMYY